MSVILDTFQGLFTWMEKVVKEDIARELSEEERQAYLNKLEGFKSELQEMGAKRGVMGRRASELIFDIGSRYVDGVEINWPASLKGALKSDKYENCLFTSAEVRKLIEQCETHNTKKDSHVEEKPKDLVERIKNLCSQKGISMNQLEADLDFASGSISKRSRKKPNILMIIDISDYFQVSVDYLLGRSEEV